MQEKGNGISGKSGCSVKGGKPAVLFLITLVCLCLAGCGGQDSDTATYAVSHGASAEEESVPYAYTAEEEFEDPGAWTDASVPVSEEPETWNEYESETEPETGFEMETAVIEKITDGDTISVRIDGGETQKVRMLEVNTPESVHSDSEKNNEYGEEASEYTKSQLDVGQTVYLTKDTSDTDRYGRLLRIVWTEIPSDPFDVDELRGKCFNAKLLLDGYAEVAIYDDEAYREPFTEFQEEAMRDRRGLWADDSWWEFLGMN